MSDALKRRAAERAVALVGEGFRVGLGTGSTARHFVSMLGERVRGGLGIIAVPTSEATHAQATEEGIPLTTLDETPELDLTVDGADELDGDLRLIKGGGGALLREKIVAAASKRMIVIADRSRAVANAATVADSVRSFVEDGDALILFDSTATVVTSGADDSLSALRAGGARAAGGGPPGADDERGPPGPRRPAGRPGGSGPGDGGRGRPRRHRRRGATTALPKTPSVAGRMESVRPKGRVGRRVAWARGSVSLRGRSASRRGPVRR